MKSRTNEVEENVILSKLLDGKLSNNIQKFIRKYMNHVNIIQKATVYDIRIPFLDIDIFLNPPSELIDNILNGESDTLSKVYVFLNKSSKDYPLIRHRSLTNPKKKIQIFPYDDESKLKWYIIELLKSKTRREKVLAFIENSSESNFKFADYYLSNIIGRDVVHLLQKNRIPVTNFFNGLKDRDSLLELELGNQFPFVYQKLFTKENC